MLTARSTRSARSSISLSRKSRAIFAVSVSAVVFNVMGRADIYPVYDQTPADYSTFDRKITLRFASDGQVVPVFAPADLDRYCLAGADGKSNNINNVLSPCKNSARDSNFR